MKEDHFPPMYIENDGQRSYFCTACGTYNLPKCAVEYYKNNYNFVGTMTCEHCSKKTNYAKYKGYGYSLEEAIEKCLTEIFIYKYDIQKILQRYISRFKIKKAANS